MEISIKTVPSADAKPAPLFVALELSKARWVVALHAPDSDKVGLYRIDGGDTERLVTLIDAKRAHAEKKLGRAVRVVCCYEAGHDGFWLHRFLLARGIDNRVLDSASILVDRRARRAKTDRLDAAALLRTLMALERGERQVCRVVHVPTVADEDRRRLSRERERLLKESTSHISRIKGLLMLHGIRAFVPTGRAWRRRLDALITADGQPLPARLEAEIARECRRLELVKELLAEVDREQMQEIERDAGAAQRLMRVRGIGATFASVLAQEVFFRDFNNRRQVGSYLGLASSPWQSGRMRRDQGVAKSGNPRARRIAIEAAWLWLRHQPTSALARWFSTRVGDMKGRIRRIVLAALARKLIVALWRYLHHGLVPEGAMLKAR
jgi:transposase